MASRVPRSVPQKLLPKVTGKAAAGSSGRLPGKSRRQEYSAATKNALVDVAEALFTEQGYAATSLDAIVAGARVTKGALYHHFSGKQALFEAVFDRVEERATAAIRTAVHGCTDPWDQAQAGLRTFLAVVQEPGYRRVVIQEGPAVLGYERFREQEERSTYGIVSEIVTSVLAGYELEQSLIDTFSRIFFGALSAAGAAVSSADDTARAGADVEAAVGFILAGLRQQAEAGAALPGAAGVPRS